jgi:hypothetical protein
MFAERVTVRRRLGGRTRTVLPAAIVALSGPTERRWIMWLFWAGEEGTGRAGRQAARAR